MKAKSKISPCIRCGGQADIRHVKIKDFLLLIRFHLHANQYYCICERCGTKTPSKHKEKFAIKVWNNLNRGV